MASARDDRRDGQRDGATGKGDVDKHATSADYRDGWQRGRSAEVNRTLTGWAGRRNPNKQ